MYSIDRGCKCEESHRDNALRCLPAHAGQRDIATVPKLIDKQPNCFTCVAVPSR